MTETKGGILLKKADLTSNELVALGLLEFSVALGSSTSLLKDKSNAELQTDFAEAILRAVAAMIEANNRSHPALLGHDHDGRGND